jgi:hypothetical protein
MICPIGKGDKLTTCFNGLDHFDETCALRCLAAVVRQKTAAAYQAKLKVHGRGCRAILIFG